MAAIRTLSPAVLAVLEGALVEGGVLRLPPDQLDRKLYVEVDKALTAMGGRWDRRARGHVFAEGVDAAAELDAALQNGAVTDRKKQLGFFETPPGIVRRLIEAARVESGMRVLEPSAGEGAIVRELPAGLRQLGMVEIDPAKKARLLSAVPGNPTIVLSIGDFLTLDPIEVVGGPLASPYDAIVMNPPFAGQADIDHVLRALDFLAPGGRLASVMSSGTVHRDNRKARDFRALVDARGGSIVPLPEGSFTASGTNVNTVLVTISGEGWESIVGRRKPALADLVRQARL